MLPLLWWIEFSILRNILCLNIPAWRTWRSSALVYASLSSARVHRPRPCCCSLCATLLPSYRLTVEQVEFKFLFAESSRSRRIAAIEDHVLYVDQGMPERDIHCVVSAIVWLNPLKVSALYFQLMLTLNEFYDMLWFLCKGGFQALGQGTGEWVLWPLWSAGFE